MKKENNINISGTNIENIVERINLLKKIIDNNTNLLRYLKIELALKNTFLFIGFVFVIFPIIFLIISSYYKGFNHSPLFIKVLYAGSIIITFFFISFFKTKEIFNSIKKYKPELKYKDIFILYFSYKNLIVTSLCYVLCTIFFIIYLLINNKPQIIPTVIVILSGMHVVYFNFFSFSFELTFIGFWYIISGFISLFLLDNINPAYFLIIGPGAGSIITYFIIKLKNFKKRTDG